MKEKYLFQLWDGSDFDFAGIGVIKKSDARSMNYELFFNPGLQRNIDCIIISHKGELMYGDSRLELINNRESLNPFFKKNDELSLDYSPTEAQVRFVNITTGKKLAYFFSIKHNDIDDYFAGVFMGKGKMMFQTFDQRTAKSLGPRYKPIEIFFRNLFRIQWLP